MVNADVGVAIKVDSVVAAVRQVVAGTSRRRSVIDVDRKAESKGTDSTAGVLRFSVRPVRREDAASAMIVIEDITQQKPPKRPATRLSPRRRTSSARR